MVSKILIIAVLLSVLFLSGCGGTRIKHVSAPEFLEIAKQIEQMSSATWTTYIGSSKTRAYLEYGDVFASSGLSRTVVYWTELEKLPEDVARELKAGKSPWVPWQNRVQNQKITSQCTRTGETGAVSVWVSTRPARPVAAGDQHVNPLMIS